MMFFSINSPQKLFLEREEKMTLLEDKNYCYAECNKVSEYIYNILDVASVSRVRERYGNYMYILL